MQASVAPLEVGIPASNPDDHAVDSYSDLLLELTMPSPAVRAELLYHCQSTAQPAVITIHAERKWLASFRRFRIPCQHCGQQHTVPARLTFDTDD